MKLMVCKMTRLTAAYNDSYQVQTNDNCPPDQFFIQEDSGEVQLPVSLSPCPTRLSLSLPFSFDLCLSHSLLVPPACLSLFLSHSISACLSLSLFLSHSTSACLSVSLCLSHSRACPCRSGTIPSVPVSLTGPCWTTVLGLQTVSLVTAGVNPASSSN